MPPGQSAHFESDAARERSLSRLFETLQFIVDVMGGNIPPPGSRGDANWRGAACVAPITGEGWKSCVRVRMLHGVGRRRILSKVGKGGDAAAASAPFIHYDPAIDGPPINQEDMAFTLSAFSMAPLYCMTRFGYSFTTRQADAVIAFWRHLGYYMGVNPSILSKHFRNWETAERFGATCGQILVLDLAELEQKAKAVSAALPTAPTVSILDAFAKKDGAGTTLEDRLAICRYLVGPKLSDLLGLPLPTWTTTVKIHFSFGATAFPIYFGRVYSSLVPIRGQAWENRRRALTVEAIARIARFKIGNRRTAFRPRNVEGELVESVATAEAVERNLTDVANFMRAWKINIAEMFGVMGLGLLVIVYSVWKLFVWL